MRPTSLQTQHLALSLALVGALGAAALAAAASEPRKAPSFRLEALEGGEIDLAALSGRFVVVHFATTWCPYCAVEAPHLENLHRTYRDRDVEVLIVDVREDEELVRGWRDRLEMTVPVLLDAEGAVAASYAPPEFVPEMPRDQVMIAANLLIDREGRIRFFSLLDSRAFDARLVELTARLEQLLAQEEEEEFGCSGAESYEPLARYAWIEPEPAAQSCSL